MIRKSIKSLSILASATVAASLSLSLSQPVIASEPFIAQITMFGGNFAPRGWAFCEGQLLSLASNTALFSILGTTYGGDGRTTFALPDLRGRTAIHPKTGPGLSTYSLGQRGGVETVTLVTSQMPSHTHDAGTTIDSADLTLNTTDADGDSQTPGGNITAGVDKGNTKIYSTGAPDVVMSPGSITGTFTASTIVSNTGGGSSHENRMPYLALNHIIALVGVYPSRN